MIRAHHTIHVAARIKQRKLEENTNDLWVAVTYKTRETLAILLSV